MLKNSFWIWDQVLSRDFCNLVLQETEWAKKEQGQAGGEVNTKVRITDVVWKSQMSPIGCVALNYINSANAQAGWDYELIGTEEIQIGRYKKEGHYDWHIDIEVPDNKNIQRKLSMSIQLNDSSEYEGGKFEFKSLEDASQPKMQQGSIMVFPSFLEHRITPILSGTRYSAVTWAGGPAFK
jgi:PKHD-type hydroxylase